jgi:hypothetical protein
MTQDEIKALIEDLRLNHEFCPKEVILQAADELERMQHGMQEPVAWGVFEGNLHDMFFSQVEAEHMVCLKGAHAEVRPLYTTPPAPQPVPVKTYSGGKPWPVAPKPWVGLTDEEIKQCVDSRDGFVEDFARVIEAKLKERNT